MSAIMSCELIWLDKLAPVIEVTMMNAFQLFRAFALFGLVICIDPIQEISAQPVMRKAVAANTGALAEEWYLPTEDKAAQLYLYEIGKGEPVVVLHGGPGAGHKYLLDIANGLDNQFRFVFYDQRGAGLSFCAKEAISMANNVEDLETIRKALGVERMNLVSHSAGTLLAMNYLQKYPQNVKNLVLLGAQDPKNGNTGYFTPEELTLFKQVGEERNRFQQRPAVQAEIEKAGLSHSPLTAKQEFQLKHLRSAAAGIYHIERWREVHFFIANKDAAQATQKSTNFVYDWSKTLAAHPYPITVINGEYDYVVGPKGSPIWKRVVATEAKNVRFVMIQKAGHLSWIDDRVAFRSALRNALIGRGKVE
jgi:proline iminopeptidase